MIVLPSCAPHLRSSNNSRLQVLITSLALSGPCCIEMCRNLDSLHTEHVPHDSLNRPIRKRDLRVFRRHKIPWHASHQSAAFRTQLATCTCRKHNQRTGACGSTTQRGVNRYVGGREPQLLAGRISDCVSQVGSRQQKDKMNHT